MNKNTFLEWMEEMDYLQSARLVAVHDNPLEIRIAYPFYDGMVVDGVDVYRQFILRPQATTKWTYKPTKRFFASPNTEINMAELHESSPKIDLIFFHDIKDVRLICESIEIEEVEPIPIESGLTYNETSVGLSASLPAVLSPAFWLEEITARDIEACFRYYGGEELSLDKIPEDYSGYFLARKSRLSASHTGIFIGMSAPRNGRIYVGLECHDAPSYDLWVNLISIFSKLPDASVSIGKITMSGKEWVEKYEPRYRRGGY